MQASTVITIPLQPACLEEKYFILNRFLLLEALRR